VRKLEIAKLELSDLSEGFFFYLFKNIMFTLVNIMFEFVFFEKSSIIETNIVGMEVVP
jgi:hypothetical protein